ncbi:MAG: late competence development ComFB family protein [Brevinematales bacterium]|nr:late competence development ComFB family protein [Brevinematales bacterium]
MLELKNILEDVVMDVINDLENSKQGSITQNQKVELASYVLNRIKPMYITSDRGFTNIVNKYKNDPQFLADIMIRVDEALKLVKKTSISAQNDQDFDKSKPYFIFPKIIGRVISSRSMMPVEDATAQLFINGKLSKMEFSDWNNPVVLKKGDDGSYSFAPAPQPADSAGQTTRFEIKIQIEKEGKVDSKFLSLELKSDFIQNVQIQFKENVLRVEDFYVAMES